MQYSRSTYKHSQKTQWVFSRGFLWMSIRGSCFLCSASPRFLFRLTIECTREYKKLDIIWSKSGCNKNIIEWMAMKISEKCKIKLSTDKHNTKVYPWLRIRDCKITHLRLHLDNGILQRKAMNSAKNIFFLYLRLSKYF